MGGRSRARSFFTLIMRKRGKPIAAVATARKITVIVWHLLSRNEDYAFGRPALLQAKIRQMELKAGLARHVSGLKIQA
jgi:transposase